MPKTMNAHDLMLKLIEQGDEAAVKMADDLAWELIEQGNETVIEALINAMADLIIRCRSQGKTFDETRLCLKARYPRETAGRYITPALHRARVRALDVGGSLLH